MIPFTTLFNFIFKDFINVTLQFTKIQLHIHKTFLEGGTEKTKTANFWISPIMAEYNWLLIAGMLELGSVKSVVKLKAVFITYYLAVVIIKTYD